MLDVIFRRDSRNRLSSVFAAGHVELPESSSDEYSLVCAAVSGILQAARLGLETVARVPLDASQKPGHLDLRWPESARSNPKVEAIVETARAASEQIASQYPQHVRVREEQET